MRYMSSPTPSVVRNAAWPGRTPKYPWRPGTTISSAISATTSRVGVATSSVRRSATLAGLGELLGLLHRLADVAHHVEGLLRELVVLALDDLLEALHGVGDLHVPARRARELLGDEERLREEALDLPRSEEHTSELQSLTNLVCRLLLEKKKDRLSVRAHRSDAGRSLTKQ